MKNYNPYVLYEIANDCIYAENYFRIFCKKHQPFPGVTLKFDSTEDRMECYMQDERTTRLWESFHRSCRLVNADPATVLATVKAMNRYEKHNKYQICLHLPDYEFDNTYTRGEERLRRFWDGGDTR